MMPSTNPTHEETAGAVGAAAGGQTPQEGIEMNTTIIARDADIHESLRHLVNARGAFDIRSDFAAPQMLPEGDAHWIDQTEVRREKPDVEGPRFAVIRVWDLRTGEQLFNGERPPMGWYPEQMGDWYDRLDWFARNLPNTYVVNGDYLFVSGGAWVITDMPNAAGEVEFTSWSSINAEMKADAARERTKWLAENAEAIAEVQPAWADEKLTWVDLVKFDDDDEPAPDMMEFRRDVGGVSIEQSCAIDDGVLSLMGEPQIRVTAVRDDFAVFSADTAAIVGVDLLAASQMLRGAGDIGAGIFDVVGKELGIGGADLHTLAHVDKDPENDVTMGDLFRMARFVGMSPSALYDLAPQEHRVAEAEAGR